MPIAITYASADIGGNRTDIVAGNKYDHDSHLRDCLARFYHYHPDCEIFIKNDKNADAVIVLKDGYKIYVELELSDKSETQLKE